MVKKAKTKSSDKILKSKLQKFVKMKEAKEDIKQALDKLNEKIEPLEKEIYDEMLALNYDRLAMSGNTFFPTARLYFSFADRAKGLAWIKKNHPALMTVNTTTLTTLLKDFVTKGKKVPKCFNRYSKEKVGMRKNIT